VGWVDLAEDREKKWVLTEAVMNFPLPKETGNFWSI